MVEHSLLAFEFIIMVIYGMLSVPLYIATIVIILKSTSLVSSFYKIYIAMAIANMLMYFNKYLSVRLPFFTCGSCLLADVFNRGSTWWMVPTVFLHWHVTYTQFMLPSLLAFDRFVVIVLGPRITVLWKKIYLWLILLLNIAPTAFTFEIFNSQVSWKYINATDNYKYQMAAIDDLVLMYESMTVIMLGTCLISLVFNLTVFLQFFCGKLKVPGSQRSVEVKLFINCVIDMTAQITTATYYQSYTLVADPHEHDLLRLATYYAIDVMSLLPPFVLLSTSAEVRAKVLEPVKNSLAILSPGHSRIYVSSSSNVVT